MSTGHVLLGLLSERPQHGYDLKNHHDAVFPAARPLAFGQVYATLERLTKKGQVEAIASEQVDGPERTVYAITDDGSEALQQWLEDIDAPAPFVANPIAVKATVALLARSEAVARLYLQAQRAAHLTRMREYTRQKTAPDTELASILACDYAIAHLAADLEWLDLALARVDALQPQPSTISEGNR